MKTIFIIFLVIGLAFSSFAIPPSSMQNMLESAIRHQAAAGGLAIVQARSYTNTGASASCVISPTAGNVLVVCGAMSGIGLTSISDNIGSTTGWTKATNCVNGGGTQSSYCWYKGNIPAGITTLTISSSGTFVSGVCYEYSGSSSPSSPFTTGESCTNLTGTSSNPQAGNVSNGTANSIFFAVVTDTQVSNPGTYTINGTGTVGTWLHYSALCGQLDAVDYQPFDSVYTIVSSTTSEKHGWSTVSNAGSQLCLIAFH